MSISLTDRPNDIFKLFEFLEVVEQFEQGTEHRTLREELLQGEFAVEKELASPLLESVENQTDIVERIPVIQETEQPIVIEEPAITTCQELLASELVPDDALSRLPADDIKDVFPFFMRASFQMPDVDETPLGLFLLQKKEEQIEDLTTYELEQMLAFTLKENKMLLIQNDVFRRFLMKNDPRYDDESISAWQPYNSEDVQEKVLVDISTAEMVDSTVVFPCVEDYDSENMYRDVLALYSRVVEQEIKSVHKEYEVALNKFNAKMKDLSSIENSSNIHRDKIRETFTLLKVMIVKKHYKKRKKVIFNLQQFTEFLKAAIKQDQQDLRRFRVMIYEHKRKISTLQGKMNSSNAIRRVDLELYEIKAKQLSSRLNEMNEEFLQLKKIFDSYHKRLDKFQKRLEISRKMLSRNQKTYLKKVRDLEVQSVCYKMALESVLEVINTIIRFHSSVLIRKRMDTALPGAQERK